MKLLIVDDEPVIVRGLLKLLDYEALGFDTVLSADNSTDALALLRYERPVAMISDIAMPGLTGLELLRLIRDESIPVSVVFVSGYRSFDYAQEALSLGAKSYLLKPVDAKALSRELTQIAESHRVHAVQARLQSHIRSIQDEPRQAEEAFPTLPAQNRSFCFACFHLLLGSDRSKLSSGLMHFSAISKGEAFFQDQGCISFPKDDYLCAVIYETDEESCTLRAQRLCEQCASLIEESLSRPFDYVIHDPLDHTQDIPSAYQACVAQLNMPREPLSAEDSVTDRIREYIAQHYGEDLTLEHMSEVFAMNANYFSSFFHQKFGVKYKDYLTRVRMTEAKRMLLQTDMMIYEISQRVGYSDIRYFSQTFAKHTGVRPKDYRNKQTR
ncbi:MAG: response regulator [Candidatus Ventricola sp.]